MGRGGLWLTAIISVILPIIAFVIAEINFGPVLTIFGPDGARARPNVVLIMADDVGLGDIGVQYRERTGQQPMAPTPNIDALAREGLWFTDAHSPTALCSPSRYAVMSGNYNYRSYAPWGVWGSFRESPFKKGDATLGTVARDAGYATGFIGKWHLGGDFYKKDSGEIYRGEDRGEAELGMDARRWIGGGPRDLGFEYDFTLPTGVQGPFYVAYENGEWFPLEEDSRLIHLNARTAKDPAFVAGKGPGTGDSAWDGTRINVLLARKASEFIRKRAGEPPFFLCYWSPAVHIPHTPPRVLDGEPVAGTTPTRHLDMNRVLDWEVKQIVEALKQTGAYDDTLIIFTSDNGGLSDPEAGKAGHLSNGGWRAYKNSPYEGGHRVPLITVWPGRIAPGTRADALVNGTDLLATLAAVVGADLKEDQGMDSWSFLSLLHGAGGFKGRSELLLQSGSDKELMYRRGPWKLIIQSDHKLTKFEPSALFNLAENPQEKETGNLLEHPDHQKRAAEMLSRYLEIRNGGGRTVPR